MPKRIKIKVVERKLGREKALGQQWPGIIEIDPGQKSRTYLDTLIHEALHECFPETSETRIVQVSRAITKVIWDKHYRRIRQ